MPIGPTELIIVLVIVVLLFGARKLPELAKSLGASAKEFKKGIQEDKVDQKVEENEQKLEQKS
jgi:sec-independent protein translocase protein TatA